MKLPKLPKSRPSSANASPVSTPRAHDNSPTSKLPSPRSPNGSKPATKSFWPEKGKSLQLRLPSLSRSRSRSKREITAASDETSASTSPIAPLPSPLGKSNSNKNLLDSNQTQGAASSLQAIRAACAQDEKHVSSESSHGNIPETLVEEIKHVFEKFDSNGDGKISAEELCCVLRSLGDNTTQEEAELMVAEVDTDKDGYIDLQEFINLNTHVPVGGVNGERPTGINVTDELVAAFNMFDLDKNGCITPDELHCVLGNLGNRTSTLEDCKRMIRGVDRKGYGHVDFDDFKIMMTTNTSIMA